MKANTIMGLAAVFMLMSCGGQTNEQHKKAPTRVRTEVVETAVEANSRTYVGIVEENQATAVSFTSMGTVRRVLVSEGQAVARGQLIAELDDIQARNLLDGARASVAQAEDALVRYGQLHEKGSMTDAQWVEVQSKVAQARSQLAVAEKNLADCSLKAPVSGIIGRRNVSAGETAMPSQAVVTILDVSSVKVKVAIPETEISSITASTPTKIDVEAAQVQVEGGTIEKGVQADALTHTYDVRINVRNSQRKLLPGMVASVQFVAMASQPSEQPMLPLTSVQKASDGSLFVWTISSDSTAHRSEVSIGETRGNRIVISEGIAQGQRVVTEGYQKLSEGTRVVF